MRNDIPIPQRERIIQRAGGLCENCGQKDWRMSIHHKKNRGMGGTTHVYTDEELEYLCGKCHSSRHGIKEG